MATPSGRDSPYHGLQRSTAGAATPDLSRILHGVPATRSAFGGGPARRPLGLPPLRGGPTWATRWAPRWLPARTEWIPAWFGVELAACRFCRGTHENQRELQGVDGGLAFLAPVQAKTRAHPFPEDFSPVDPCARKRCREAPKKLQRLHLNLFRARSQPKLGWGSPRVA